MKSINKTDLIHTKELINKIELLMDKHSPKHLKKIKNYKLLDLKLIKSKIFKKKNYLKNITIKDISFRLRKALHIIYLYHTSKKRITFVGNPLNINKEITKLLQKTDHKFLPTSAWMAGIITNRYNSLKWLFKKERNTLNKISQRLLNFKKRNDLVVILDKDLNSVALNESYKSKIPIISLNNNLNPFDLGSDYKIPGDFLVAKGEIKNNLFYSILVSTFKKAVQTKLKFSNFFREKLSTINTIKKKYNNMKKKGGFVKNSNNAETNKIITLVENSNNTVPHESKLSDNEQRKKEWEELTLSQRRKVTLWIKVKREREKLQEKNFYTGTPTIWGSVKERENVDLNMLNIKKNTYPKRGIAKKRTWFEKKKYSLNMKKNTYPNSGITRPNNGN